MLKSFDWICRSRNGAELLSTLSLIDKIPYLFNEMESIGYPCSAFNIICQRCWLYSRVLTNHQEHCKICELITKRAHNLGNLSKKTIVIWGCVNYIPSQIELKQNFYADKVNGLYVHDNSRFLLTMRRHDLTEWIKELLIYNGSDLKGLIQIFPTIGHSKNTILGDLLCRAIHNDSRFPMDSLRVRFFSNPYSVFHPSSLDEKGLLTFEITEFLRLLEGASIFKSLLRPQEQELLKKIVNITDRKEEKFYWGRFQSYLTKEAQDMADSWKIRSWPKEKISFLYNLLEYVSFTF